jgi:hypothetical protein
MLAIVPTILSVLTDSVDNQTGTKSAVETASYIIYQDGDYACLKNGTTGRIIERLESHVDVIQDAVDLGGVVYIAPGNYSSDTPANITIESSSASLIGSGIDSSCSISAS